MRASIATHDLYSHTSSVMMGLTASPTDVLSRFAATHCAWPFEKIKLWRIHQELHSAGGLIQNRGKSGKSFGMYENVVVFHDIFDMNLIQHSISVLHAVMIEAVTLVSEEPD